MEFVRHHVTASGSTTLREFFASENVDYDPPSNSLRENIKKAKCRFVYETADGATGDDEEVAIRDVMKNSENSYELVRMFFAIRGWAGLDDELPEAYLDPIASRLAQVLDQRDYVVYQLIRRHLSLIDYNASPNLGDCFTKLLQWPLIFQPAEFDFILGRKLALLMGIASATLRNRSNMVNAARVTPAVIQAYDATAPHREDDLIALMYEINYTTRVCASLELLKYDDLYNVILEMADPAITDVRQRLACRDTVERLTPEFSVARLAVEFAGTNEAKSTIARFMLARKAALDSFSPTVPTATIIGAIAAAIGSVATTLADLRTAIINLPDILTTSISLPGLADSDSDDRARRLISEASSQNWLARMAFSVKLQAINALLSGFTDDDDEIAINTTLKAAKEYDQAELYQLAAAATWESLYSSFDGDEYDELESILNQPA